MPRQGGRPGLLEQTELAPGHHGHVRVAVLALLAAGSRAEEVSKRDPDCPQDLPGSFFAGDAHAPESTRDAALAGISAGGPPVRAVSTTTGLCETKRHLGSGGHRPARVSTASAMRALAELSRSRGVINRIRVFMASTRAFEEAVLDCGHDPGPLVGDRPRALSERSADSGRPAHQPETCSPSAVRVTQSSHTTDSPTARPSRLTMTTPLGNPG